MELGAKNFDELIRQDPRDYRATNHRLNDIPSRLVKGHKVPRMAAVVALYSINDITLN